MFTLMFLAASAVMIKVQSYFADKEEWAHYTRKQFEAAKEAVKEQRTLEVQKKGKELLVAIKLRKLLDTTPGSIQDYLVAVMPAETRCVIMAHLTDNNKLPEVGDVDWKDSKELLYWAEALRQSLSAGPSNKKQERQERQEAFSAPLPQGDLV